jgi:hypothetical protein
VAEDEVRDLVDQLTDGLGADVSIEAVGFPDAFELTADLVCSGGRIANMGVHEGPATLHLEKLWAKQVTITTGIPSGLTIPQLMNSISTGALDATTMIGHRMPLTDILKGHDPDAVGVGDDLVQLGQPVDVDQVGGRDQAHVEQRDQALAAGQDLAVVADLGQLDQGLGDGRGSVVGEGWGVHTGIIRKLATECARTDIVHHSRWWETRRKP